MNHDDSVSAMTDSSRFWPEKYHKSHESVLWQRQNRQHQHFVQHYQLKIKQLYEQLAQTEQNQQRVRQAKAVRLSQPFEQVVNTLKEKYLAFDELMRRFDQLSQGRLTLAIHQIQVNRHNGMSHHVAPLIAKIENLIQAYAKRYLTPLTWQTVYDRLSIIPMQTMAVQCSSFLDFRRQCQVTAKMAARECQRDTWRLNNMVLDLARWIEQLESVNQHNGLRDASPSPQQSTPLASIAASIPRSVESAALTSAMRQNMGKP